MDSRPEVANDESTAPVSPFWAWLRTLGTVCAVAGIFGTWTYVALRGTLFQWGFEPGNAWVHESPTLVLYGLEGLLLLGLVLRCAAWAGHTGLWLPPERRRVISRPKAAATRGCALGFAWFASVLAVTLLMNEAFTSLSTRVVRLERSGPFAEAALLARGRAGLHVDLYARARAGDDFEIVASIGKHLECTWPFDVRESATRAAYLIVDAEKLIVALVDLELREIIARPERMPSLDRLRMDFGPGLDGHRWTDDD